MKKIFFVLFIFIVFSGSAIAGDIDFVFEDAYFHDDYLFGLAPLYARIGLDYSGLEFIEGQRTDLIAVVGGVLVSSSPWTDENGDPYLPNAAEYNDDAYKDANSYSRWQGDFGLTLKQGLIHEAGRKKALFAVYGKYGFHITDPEENYGGSVSKFLSGSSSAYPDNNGTITNIIKTGFEVDRLDKGDIYEGFNIDGSITYAPPWFFNDLVGTSDFYGINLTARGFIPLLDLKQEGSELELLGIYLGNRLMVDYLTGTAIPQFYQESPSLGKKMRGFESNTMGTEFTIVNNLDVRFYVYELIDDIINPVVNLFFDMGYFAGNYYNTQTPGNGFRCSTGFELALNLFDFAQVGGCFAFPLVGENMAESAMMTSLILQYKF